MEKMTPDSLLEEASLCEAKAAGRELPQDMIDRMIARTSSGGPSAETIAAVRKMAKELAASLETTQRAMRVLEDELAKDKLGSVVPPIDRNKIQVFASDLYRMKLVAELVSKSWPQKRA